MKLLVIQKLSKLIQRNFLIATLKNLQISTLLILILFLLQSCSKSENQNITATTKKIPYVKVQPAKITSLATFIDITGTIQANIYTDIVSPADGIIETLLARENQTVHKDNIIAVINPNDRVALIANNQLRIQQLEQKINSAEKNSENYSSLVQELEKAKINLEYAKKMHQPIPVICSMNGMVTHRWLDEGSQVGAKEKIITISDMRTLVIKSEVNEKFFPAISKGKKLTVVLNAFPYDTLTGFISLVYPEISADTRTVKFDVKLLNSGKKILPGMMAQIRIPVEIHKNAIALPSDAVLTNPANERFVFVVNKDSMAFRRIVKTGISAKKQIEILSGVTENENVIIMGQEMLKDSMKVKIVGTPDKSKK